MFNKEQKSYKFIIPDLGTKLSIYADDYPEALTKLQRIVNPLFLVKTKYLGILVPYEHPDYQKSRIE